jgi:hypothetical protein
MIHSALSSIYPVGDPRRFNMGTPKEVWSTLERCWTIAPTSERIVQDIMKLPDILKKIIECNGCVVQDLNFRTGRRYRRADDSGDCKTKPRLSSRKATLALPPIHGDCIEALTLMRNFNPILIQYPPHLKSRARSREASFESSDSSDSDDTETTLQPEDCDSDTQDEEPLILCTSVATV